MHDGISFDCQNKWMIILGQEWTETTLENREFGHNAHVAV
jgi:hypothetical protein